MIGRTDLCPYELREGADELRCCVAVALETFFVDDLADCVPEGGLETLRGVSVLFYQILINVKRGYELPRRLLRLWCLP